MNAVPRPPASAAVPDVEVFKHFDVFRSGDRFTLRCQLANCTGRWRFQVRSLAQLIETAQHHWYACHPVDGLDLPAVLAEIEALGQRPGYVLTCRYCHRADRALKPLTDHPGEMACVNSVRCVGDMDRLLGGA